MNETLRGTQLESETGTAVSKLSPNASLLLAVLSIIGGDRITRKILLKIGMRLGDCGVLEKGKEAASPALEELEKSGVMRSEDKKIRVRDGIKLEGECALLAEDVYFFLGCTMLSTAALVLSGERGEVVERRRATCVEAAKAIAGRKVVLDRKVRNTLRAGLCALNMVDLMLGYENEDEGLGCYCDALG